MIPNGNIAARARAVRQWPTWVALVALWIFTLAEQFWLFPALFLAWAAYDLVTGQSSFVQRVTRREQPVTYWLVVATWIALSILWIVYPT